MATPQRFLSLSRIGNATAENLTVLPSSVRALAHRAAVFCALILPMWPTGRLHHWGRPCGCASTGWLSAGARPCPRASPGFRGMGRGSRNRPVRGRGSPWSRPGAARPGGPVCASRARAPRRRPASRSACRTSRHPLVCVLSICNARCVSNSIHPPADPPHDHTSTARIPHAITNPNTHIHTTHHIPAASSDPIPHPQNSNH